MAGADPSFSETHLLRALFIIDSGPVGRKNLVKLLGVGEGSVRTIIKRLTAEKLIESSKQGHTLTPNGRKAVDEKLKLMTKPVEFEATGLVEGCQSLIIVRNARARVKDGVALRDIALKSGADGAILLVYDGALKFPTGGLDLSDYPEAKRRLGGLELALGDAVVIGFGETPAKAEDGAVSVAEKLLK
jgi:predicted transcriptional regulator